MNIGVLLAALIEIAQIPKTEFAISMNMTPSGLSKILTGRRLPISKEKRTFSSQAAHRLAEAIYEHDCYRKFNDLFPVIYNFASRHELEVFLAYAIEDALDKAFAAEGDADLDFPEKEESFLGKKTVLNALCVTLSEYFRMSRTVPLEFYSAIPIMDPVYYDVLSRIEIIGARNKERNTINHFVCKAFLEAPKVQKRMNLLSTIVEAEKTFDFKIWETEEKIQPPFLFLQDRILILFSVAIDGKTPLVTFITNKSYLSIFFNSLMKQEAKQSSFTQQEAIEELQADPTIMTRLLKRRMDAAYNFITIGYLVKKGELKGTGCSDDVRTGILSIFEKILTDDTTFFVTLDAMMEFYYTGKAIVPLVGAIDFPKDARIPYLSRFNAFIGKKDADKVKVIDSKLPRASLLCSEGLTIVFLIDSDYQNQKIHFFRTDVLAKDLADELCDSSSKLIEFNVDLWDSYLAGLSG